MRPVLGRPVRVLIVFNTPFLYGMERAVIETFDVLRPEVEPLFLMTHYAYRNDLPVYREVKRRGLEHVFFSDVTAWPRLGKPTSVRHLVRLLGAFVRGNVDTLRAMRGQDVLYLPSVKYMGLAVLACVWFRMTGRRVALQFHDLLRKATAREGDSLAQSIADEGRRTGDAARSHVVEPPHNCGAVSLSQAQNLACRGLTLRRAPDFRTP